MFDKLQPQNAPNSKFEPACCQMVSAERLTARHIQKSGNQNLAIRAYYPQEASRGRLFGCGGIV